MDEEALAVEFTLLEKGDSLLQEVKIKLLERTLSKDPILGSRGGAFCSSWETGGGIKQGAKGHGFLDGGASLRAACAQIANILP